MSLSGVVEVIRASRELADLLPRAVAIEVHPTTYGVLASLKWQHREEEVVGGGQTRCAGCGESYPCRVTILIAAFEAYVKERNE